MYELYDYQQDAVNSIIEWISKSIEPVLLEAATGAGKSLIVSKVAEWVEQKSNKKVLCLAPSKELTEQNYSKYEAYNLKASYFSSSLGKSLRHNVIFGTPLTVKNSLKRFSNGNFAAVILDEAHNITPTIKNIILELKESNQNLRVIGLTATPYRMGEGYIYSYWPDGKAVSDDEKLKETFFHTLCYQITAEELIAKGRLTPPLLDTDHVNSYDTSMMNGFSEKEQEKAFEGKGRKTSKIIADVVNHSHGKMGVMIFAATVKHAIECSESLPIGSWRIVTSDTTESDREKIVRDFKNRKFKYLVNVAVFTTGFDAPHVDLIAVLRATESPGLFQQIIGRGLRLHELKKHCVILDYAGNVERHQLVDNLFVPRIKTRKKKDGKPVDVCCPSCSFINTFSMRDNPSELEINKDGYFLDLAGNVLLNDGGTPIPGHYGRRCFGYSIVNGKAVRCEHRWSVKECPECDHENDIAARYCEKCKAELVDPNEKLVLDFHKMKKDPYSVSTDPVEFFHVTKHISQAGNKTLRATYKTPYRKFDYWYQPNTRSVQRQNEFKNFCLQSIGLEVGSVDEYLKHSPIKPETITYCRVRNTKFYKIFDYNKPIDEIPTNEVS